MGPEIYVRLRLPLELSTLGFRESCRLQRELLPLDLSAVSRTSCTSEPSTQSLPPPPDLTASMPARLPEFQTSALPYLQTSELPYLQTYITSKTATPPSQAQSSEKGGEI